MGLYERYRDESPVEDAVLAESERFEALAPFVSVGPDSDETDES